MGKDSAKPGVGARSSPKRSRSQGYPKSVRLRKRREFLAVQRTGRRFHAEHFLAVVQSSAGTTTPTEGSRRGRVGITVTKKVGNAVIRNRIKRLVREYVRKGSWLGIPVDTVFIAKRSAAGLVRYHDVAVDLSSIRTAVERSAASLGRARERRSSTTSAGKRGRTPC